MTEKCRLQVNYKGGVADLINVYADTSSELEHLLDTLADTIPAIKAVEVALKNGGNPSAAAQAVQNVLAAFPAAQVVGAQTEVHHSAVPAQAAAPAAAGPACQHGPMQYKEGVSKAGKAYKGHFCNAKPSCPAVWA